MINAPKISVIIPVYNTEKYLRECLDSVVNQTLRDFEIICVDDGSTDGSLEILWEYAAADGRMRVFTQKNLHAGIARNHGLRQARGEYCAFLDSDDILLPNALQVLLRRAEAVNADVVLCAARVFQKNSAEASKRNCYLNTSYLPNAPVFNKNSLSKHLFQITTGECWRKLIRKDLIDENHICFPDLPRTEDIPFTYWVLSLADRICAIDEALYLHRSFPGSGSLDDRRDIHPTTPIIALGLLWDKLKELELSDLLRQTFLNKVVDSVYYNFLSFRSIEGFAKMYECFRDAAENVFHMDFEDGEQYYNKKKYLYVKEIAASKSVEEYLFQKQKQNDSAILSSRAYRIGRAITWLPRKLNAYRLRLLSAMIRMRETLSGR